jgi:hypothetical protein
MRITFKRKNVRRWVSLSALGAGALTLAGTAEADIIETTLNPPESIGFDPGFGTAPIKVTLPGGAGFSLYRKASHRGSSAAPVNLQQELILLRGTGGQEAAGNGHGVLDAFSKGQTWGMAASSFGGNVATRHKSTIKSSHLPTFGPIHHTGYFTFFNSTDRYFLFKFPDGGKTLYGWAQVTVSVTPTTGPNLTLLDYAYDDTGAKIAAAATVPASAVPEPSETIPMALAALVLGAAGVRRWRASKAA